MPWITRFRSNIRTALFLFATAAAGALLVRDHDVAAMTPLPEKALQPKEADPKASAPAVKEGLEVVVQPAKATFVENEPIVFTVTLTNASDKNFMLFESGFFWDWKIRFGNWQVVNRRDFKRAYPPSMVLAPGKSTVTTVELDNTKDVGFQFDWTGDQLAKPPAKRYLPVGKYPLVIDVRLAEDIRRERLMDYKFPHWAGTITSNPTTVVIVPAQK